MTEYLPFIAPVIVALAGGGALAAFLTYRKDRPKTEAEAAKVKAEVVVTFADGWEKLARETLLRFDALNIRFDAADKELRRLRDLIDEKDKAHQKALLQKDEEIRVLNEHNTALRSRIGRLEGALKAYTDTLPA
jgi:hypothetical protein